MNETILKIVQQNEYDRYVFLTYLNNQIIGLNFWQGIYKESYESVMDSKGYEPCIHLTEIYNRLKINYEEISDDERINKAIELYTNSFIFQKESLFKQIFNDVDGNELKVGDKVVCVDVDDLESHIISRGLVLEVNKLIDLESCYIEFKAIDCLLSFYGHRVLKLKF